MLSSQAGVQLHQMLVKKHGSMMDLVFLARLVHRLKKVNARKILQLEILMQTVTWILYQVIQRRVEQERIATTRTTKLLPQQTQRQQHQAQALASRCLRSITN
jgi:hypothetical protein